MPAHQKIIAYGLNLSMGRGLAAIFVNGLRKNQQDYVKLLIKRATRGPNPYRGHPTKYFGFVKALKFQSRLTRKELEQLNNPVG